MKFKKKIKKLGLTAIKNFPIANQRKKCNICQKTSTLFLPFGVKETIFNTLNIIGGGRRKEAICPQCGSIDRLRWSYYVIENFTDIFTGNATILHIAPEKTLSDKIRKNKNCTYLTGDIEAGRAEHVVDITQMQFSDEFFDFIIMNHVLEHVPDEALAISELKRCLKKNGKLILSFPICLDQATFEDQTILLENERLKAYGQKDHCRLYGYDAQESLENYGLWIKD